MPIYSKQGDNESVSVGVWVYSWQCQRACSIECARPARGWFAFASGVSVAKREREGGVHGEISCHVTQLRLLAM